MFDTKALGRYVSNWFTGDGGYVGCRCYGSGGDVWSAKALLDDPMSIPQEV